MIDLLKGAEAVVMKEILIAPGNNPHEKWPVTSYLIDMAAGDRVDMERVEVPPGRYRVILMFVRVTP